MLRSLAVVGAIVVALVILNYRAPQDPVREVDADALAQQVATVAPYPVLLPTDPGWRPTAARWEPTAESEPAEVWFVAGVYAAEGPFASLSQSAAASPEFIAAATGDGAPVDSVVVGEVQWQHYESLDGDRSLLLADPQYVAIVAGSGTWEDLERFAGSLAPVSGDSGQAAG